MQQALAWLTHPQGHIPIGTEDWGVVRDGALAIEGRIRALGVTVMWTGDAWQFRECVERADAQYQDADAVPSIAPLLNRHIDPITKHLAWDEFCGLVGVQPTRPARILATATGAQFNGPIRYLLTSQRLWCDRDEDRPFLSVTVEGDDPALDNTERALHCGSTWVDIEHRRKGLGALMARLNVMCAWLRFGAWPIFGTVPANSNLSKTFAAERVIGTADCDGTRTTLIYFGRQYLVSEAARIISDGIQPPDQPWARP